MISMYISFHFMLIHACRHSPISHMVYSNDCCITDCSSRMEYCAVLKHLTMVVACSFFIFVQCTETLKQYNSKHSLEMEMAPKRKNPQGMILYFCLTVNKCVIYYVIIMPCVLRYNRNIYSRILNIYIYK